MSTTQRSRWDFVRAVSAAAALLGGVIGGSLARAQPVEAAAWDRVAEAEFTWHDNASRADRSSDRVETYAVAARLAATTRDAWPNRLAMIWGGGGELEYWPEHDGLSRFTARADASLQRKLGLGASAPTVALSGSVDHAFARESARAGWGGKLRADWRKRLNEGWRLELGAQATRRDARAAVFAETGHGFDAQLSYDATEAWRLTATVAWRRGDVVSYAIPPHPTLGGVARARQNDNTTFDERRTAYRVGGDSVSAGLAAAYALNDTSALRLAFEHDEVDTRGGDYRLNRISAGVVARF